MPNVADLEVMFMLISDQLLVLTIIRKAIYRIHSIIGESNIWRFAKKSLLASFTHQACDQVKIPFITNLSS